MNTAQDQRIIYVSRHTSIQGNQQAFPFLRENERIAFDLTNRALVLTTGDLATGVARLSPTDAHLMLALVSFYPHYVSDATLAIGYTTDLWAYYHYLKGEEQKTRNVHASYPIADGIDRLKKKVIPLGITIVRVRATGYILERCGDALSTKGTSMHNLMQSGK